MEALVVHKFSGRLQDIKASNIPVPEPKDDEVLVKVVAAGVNFVDMLYAQGKHQNNKKLVRPPFTLGLEFSGTVVSTPASSPLQPGDAVFGASGGSYAEYLTLPANSETLYKLPSSWSLADAAGLGATLPVAYGALVLRAGLKQGETVLVHSAAGGLGVMATQVAAALGCRVYGTAGSPQKCAYAESFGADRCVDYSEGSWWDEILRETEGKGVDVVFDPVGLVDRSLKCLAHCGRIIVAGFAGRGGDMEQVAMNRLLLKQAQLIGYRFGESLRRYPGEAEQIWRELRPLMESGTIKPTVSKYYEGLNSVPRALEDLAARRISGKASIIVSPASTKEHSTKL